MPFWRRKENRAENIISTEKMITTENIGAEVLRALIGGNAPLSKSQASEVSSVSSCIKLIADKIASLPLKLYEKDGEKVKEITDDIRVRLLNGDTGDTLNATEMRREWVQDYFLGKGAYTYIERDIFGDVKSLRYVREENISITTNADPIFKAYDIYVNGQKYYPHDFLKILRRNDGYGKGKSIAEENNLLFSVAYNTMKFENALVKKGGSKKGFLMSKNRLDKAVMDSLKASFREIYANNGDNENVVVLNDGLEFVESSSTSVEMQLNENKLTSRNEICSIFETPPEILNGKASEQVQALWVKNCIMPLLNVIEAACDSDLLLESEKEKRYFAFDTVELTRGDFNSRMNGYAIALDKNVMQLDEVREREDLPPLGFNFIKLGLQDVLLDVKANRIYTPNTNKFQDLGDMTPTEENVLTNPENVI
ncbi:MAG: phage portal protein [Oscillospiraceae bacterium]|nr:phage portal protein [Oscillospiraceae bacterium]